MTLTHPSIRNGWFYEENEGWAGQALSLRVEKVLHIAKSEFQDILVFKSTDYGNVLVLDGVIQATERDEFAYQEMIAHVALNAHPDPRRVLVIGGGDGGVLREIVKHKGVESVELVEIDEEVIKLARAYLPQMAKGFNDPRVKVHITDGFEFLREKGNEYDVVISDTSDPEGPAEKLFQVEYFKLVHNVLTKQGVASMQASENVWLRLPLLEELQTRCKQVFPVVKYTHACVPTYTSGQLGIMICCKDEQADPRVPFKRESDEDVARVNRYYNYELHQASFVVPTFARKSIDN